MRNLLTTFALALTVACSTPTMEPMRGAVVSTIERVVERHDSYVNTDEGLDVMERDVALFESASVDAMLSLDEVNARVLEDSLEPVMVRHDEYVYTDPLLEDIEREIYMESTARLRSLLEAVPSAPAEVE